MAFEVVRDLSEVVEAQSLEVHLLGDRRPPELVMGRGLVGHLRPVAGPAALHHDLPDKLTVVPWHYLEFVEAAPTCWVGFSSLYA